MVRYGTCFDESWPFIGFQQSSVACISIIGFVLQIVLTVSNKVVVSLTKQIIRKGALARY